LKIQYNTQIHCRKTIKTLFYALPVWGSNYFGAKTNEDGS